MGESDHELSWDRCAYPRCAGIPARCTQPRSAIWEYFLFGGPLHTTASDTPHRGPTMAIGRFVSYLRVSTARQGASGLGLEAQRASVAAFLIGGTWELLDEFVEVESGGKANRPKLAEALARCRRTGAVLVIAKLDRLSRDLHFLTGLQKAGVRFVAADMPEANDLVVHIMAAVAQAERKMISARTTAALAAAKARGVILGKPGNLRNQDEGRVAGRARRTDTAKAFHADILPIVTRLRGDGLTFADTAAELNRQGIQTPRGGAWSITQISRVLARAT